MRKFVLEQIEEEVKARKTEVREAVPAVIRSIFWSFVPVVITYYLYQSWDAKFPTIIWFAPIVLPPLLFLKVAVLQMIPVTYVFTDKYLKKRSGASEKIAWKRVRRWSMKTDGEWLILEFNMSFGRKVEFQLHKIHGEDKIRNLIRTYGKI